MDNSVRRRSNCHESDLIVLLQRQLHLESEHAPLTIFALKMGLLFSRMVSARHRKSGPPNRYRKLVELLYKREPPSLHSGLRPIINRHQLPYF
jgi:hypothetical protein